MKGLIRMIVFLRNVSINTLHKGDDDNDDNNNNNNNNNNNTTQSSDEGADTNDSLSQKCKYKCPA